MLSSSLQVSLQCFRSPKIPRTYQYTFQLTSRHTRPHGSNRPQRASPSQPQRGRHPCQQGRHFTSTRLRGLPRPVRVNGSADHDQQKLSNLPLSSLRKPASVKHSTHPRPGKASTRRVRGAALVALFGLVRVSGPIECRSQLCRKFVRVGSCAQVAIQTAARLLKLLLSRRIETWS
jgi:hypothetical protein